MPSNLHRRGDFTPAPSALWPSPTLRYVLPLVVSMSLFALPTHAAPAASASASGTGSAPSATGATSSSSAISVNGKTPKVDDEDADVETNAVELPETPDDNTHKPLPEDDEEPAAPASKAPSDSTKPDGGKNATPPLPPAAPPPPPPSSDATPVGGRSVILDNSGSTERYVAPVEGSSRLESSSNSEPAFTRPEDGPVKGGSLLLDHPNAEKGLMTIDEKNVYHYQLPTVPKDKSFSFRIGSMQAPKVEGSDSAAGPITFQSMYGSDQLIQLVGEYEFQKITRYGVFGLNFGAGFSTAHGTGFFKDPSTFRTDETSQEGYDIFIFPLNFFGSYRFEFNHRQWIIPYVKAGGSVIGLLEYREDGKQINYAVAPAVGGGGGLMLSLTKVDPSLSFTISNEYGLSDLYFTVEGRGLVGLRSDIDFTGVTIDAGIVADF